MPRAFELPDVGEGVHEGELVEWLVEPGDTVEEDQPVAKVETDKALVDVPSPFHGTVRELRWEEGDVVDVGDVLLVFNVEGEDDDAIAAGETASSEADEGDVQPDTEESSADAPPASAEAAAADATETADDTSADDGGRVFAAPSARRLARELGVEIHAVEGSGPGGRVTEGDVRAAADAGESGDDGGATATGDDGGTEAAVDAGVEGDAGADADTGADADAGAAAGAGAAGSGQSAAGQDLAGQAAADRDRTLAAPATRRLAEEHGVEIDAVPATEERDGEPFVTPEAVVEYAEAQQQAQAADAEAVSAGSEAETGGGAQPTSAPGEKPERREAYRGVRRSIGEAMAESKYTAPHVTHHDEADVTELVATKERLAERAEERGIRLTYMPFVLKAVTAALKEYPVMNAALDEDAEEIVYKEFYDLGIATATDVGLMVPVLEDVDGKGLLQLASELDELVERARERTIAPEELRGSTFSVTNVGAIGGEYATPILNYPEVGILALGQIRRKPRVVVEEGADGTETESIEPRSILPLSLSIDHRLVDGAVAAKFTNTIIEHLETPELLLLE